MKLFCLCSTKEQFSALLYTSVQALILEYDCFPLTELKTRAEEAKSRNKAVYYAFPLIWRTNAELYYEAHAALFSEAMPDGFLIRNFEALEFVKRHAFPGRLISDHSLYAFNSEAKSVLKKAGFDWITAPLELNVHELLAADYEGEQLTVYGRIRMMTAKNCIHKTLEKCDRKGVIRTVTDRMNHGLLAVNHCLFCENVLLNCLPTCLFDMKEAVLSLSPDSIRLEFTVEDASETERIANAFSDAFLYGKACDLPVQAFTRGHFKRGVE